MKRVLFDENMPRKLRRDLPEFAIRTAQEEGWSAFKNGDLLRRAVVAFDVFVTIDQRMRYQQNMARFQIGIVAIECPTRGSFTCGSSFLRSERQFTVSVQARL